MPEHLTTYRNAARTTENWATMWLHNIRHPTYKTYPGSWKHAVVLLILMFRRICLIILGLVSYKVICPDAFACILTLPQFDIILGCSYHEALPDTPHFQFWVWAHFAPNQILQKAVYGQPITLELAIAKRYHDFCSSLLYCHKYIIQNWWKIKPPCPSLSFFPIYTLIDLIHKNNRVVIE